MIASNAPLPGFRRDSAWHESGTGNLGLWYDKHFHRWRDLAALASPQRVGDALGKDARTQWIEAALKAAASGAQATMLSDLADRQKQFAGARGGASFRARTLTKFATGLGRAHPVQNGFEWHHTLGAPVLRGSGQKGAVREWITRWNDPDPDAARILGTDKPPTSGAVTFLPALPAGPFELSVDGTTPHLTEYYQQGKPPADWYNPVPLQWLAVAPGCVFQFAVIPVRAGNCDDAEKAGKWLADALCTLGAGAGTNVDRGIFELVESVKA